jgi:hypothetical protein
MGVAFFPVLEKQIDGLDLSFCGKMLAKLDDNVVQKRAELSGFEPLMNFFGFDRHFVEEFDIDTAEETKENWFSSDEGLKSSGTMLKDLRENPKEYLLTENELSGAIKDLERLSEILYEAKKCQVKWYLAIDF